MKINKQLVNYKNNGWGYNSMSPTEITIHNTANSAAAINERNYVESQLNAGNNTATYHYAVDENEAVQLLPHDINGWHSGDGDNGTGNRKSIGIEICRSTGGNYTNSEKNAIELCAKLINDGVISGVDKIKLHFDRSGKNCPHKMIENNGGADEARAYFRNEVSKLLNKDETTTTKEYVEVVRSGKSTDNGTFKFDKKYWNDIQDKKLDNDAYDVNGNLWYKGTTFNSVKLIGSSAAEKFIYATRDAGRSYAGTYKFATSVKFANNKLVNDAKDIDGTLWLKDTYFNKVTTK